MIQNFLCIFRLSDKRESDRNVGFTFFNLSDLFQKIPLYQAVNKLKGYDEIRIHSPSEVIYEE